MRKKPIFHGLGIHFITSAVLLLCVATLHADDPEEEVQTAVARFYVALNANLSGDASLMLDVWSHSDDVTHMGPFGGIRVGWDEVRAGYERLAQDSNGDRVQIEDSHLVVGDHFAIHVGYQKVTTNRNDQSGELRIRTTDVFRREYGSWKVIAHHTDQLVSGN